MNKLAALCGLIMVLVQIIVRGIRYNHWFPSLPSIIEVFLSGMILPSGFIILSFSLFGKPEINIVEYQIPLTVAGIALLYCGIYRIIKEIKEQP